MAARRLGFRWTQATIATIESGRRNLTVGEFFALPFVVAQFPFFPTNRWRRIAGFVGTSSEEPVVALAPYDDWDEALRRVNDSKYGLQAGIFTRDLARIQRAFDVLEVGAVLANDVPTWRADRMPYGGVKESGSGREGPAYAMEEFTEPRLLVIRS